VIHVTFRESERFTEARAWLYGAFLVLTTHIALYTLSVCMPSPEQMRLWEIFHPRAADEGARILKDQVRLVHYTRAETALKILRDKELWMRKTTCMTDFTEVQHGLDCLITLFSRPSGKRFHSTLHSMFAGYDGNRFAELFTSALPRIKFNTYLTCFSEHTKTEDTCGRLSMWRAYAANTGVAIVLKNSVFQIPSSALNIYLSPVAYLNDAEVSDELDRVSRNILTNHDFIQQQGVDAIVDCVFRMVYYGSVSIKNPCFVEEKEWRLVHSPDLYPSELLKEGCESVLGVPQPIYKIPLQGIPEVDTSTFIDRIIIGPTQYFDALYDAFTAVLKKFGVKEPNVYSSNIPLRT
jgi:hypothetical protein